DQRSEIYALGCVLFEALTGEVPFVGETALETISMHASRPAPKLSDVNSEGSSEGSSALDYPEELEAIVSKCLEKEQDNRFQSVDELSEALLELGEESGFTMNRARRSAAEMLVDGGTVKGSAGDSKNKSTQIILAICILIVGVPAIFMMRMWQEQ